MKIWTKLCCIFASLLLFLTACGEGDTTVVLTTGFKKDEVFKIEKVSCTLPEIMIYLTNTQNQYENVYGQQIWETDLDGVTLEENVKETVLARMAQVKSMTLLAQSKGVVLDEYELALADQAANEYFQSLNETEIALMGIEHEDVRRLYEDYALAQKVYKQIIRDINPEISDDEARTITVQHILIKTYTIDGTGQKVEFTEHAKETAYATAAEVHALATSGEQSFETLAGKYSDDEVLTYSFGKGEMDQAFESAAFNLGNGEISGIVESRNGYHIIKCMNTFNREETDNNKLKIVEERKKEVFGQEYDAFVNTLTRKLNDELWQQVEFIHDENVTTSNFFDIYDKYFS
ncbi:MAG: peptidylprolyl isomerase [Lachnospiraceae bacterium]|nr:peptidylprolyl isomerase [Lachnospiraceae bacterium]